MFTFCQSFFLAKKRTTNKDLEQEMVLMRVKGGAVVDPDSGLEDRASVARDSKGRARSAVLGMVDLVKGYNSYYRLVPPSTLWRY